MSIRHLSASAAILVALAAAPVAAQGQAPASPSADAGRETLRLTLDEAVRRAVASNPDLAVVRLGTEVEAARVGESRPVVDAGPRP